MAFNTISGLSGAKKEFVLRFSQELGRIENVKAVVLGGSHATGRAHENSDIDLGIYYYEKSPFSIEAIREVAGKYSMDGIPVVVDFYAWGPWVNGGAWINTEIGKVDLLYRNIDQVEKTISEAKAGRWENHFEQQPPYGFTSMIYMAECETCVPLSDPGEVMKALKESTRPYPKALKENVVNTALWSAEFALIQVGGFAKQNDMYSTMGCFTRILKKIAEALFALNEIYPIGDKGAIRLLSQAGIVPGNLEGRVDAVMMADVLTLDKNVRLIRELFEEVVGLANGLYRPKFNFKTN